MSSDNNKLLLKNLKGKGGDKQKSSFNIPGLDSVKKSLGKTSPKQALDIFLFATGIYVMYRFGKSVADTIENQMPTEKSMMEMMKQMQTGGPGMMPPPPM